MPSDVRIASVPHLFENGASLNQRLAALHDRLLERVPSIARIACALYDPAEDLLKTFINSTREGEPIAAYQFKLSESRSLSDLAAKGEFRVIDEISTAIKADNEHSAWLLAQGEDIVPIPGTNHVKNLDLNVAAVDVQLSDADVKELSRIFAPGAGAGLRYNANSLKGMGI